MGFCISNSSVVKFFGAHSVKILSPPQKGFQVSGIIHIINHYRRKRGMDTLSGFGIVINRNTGESEADTALIAAPYL